MLHPNPRKELLLFLILLLSSQLILAQNQEQNETSKEAPPSLLTQRANENYEYLRDTAENAYQKGFADKLKFISLNANRTVYLTIGGEYRVRYEATVNQDYTTKHDAYFSQRAAFHTNWVLGKYVRLFGELYHGYTTEKDRLFQSDEISLHQGFIEFKIPLDEEQQFSLRVGRQEKEFGASRLVGLRNGPNVRRTFDLGSLTYTKGQTSIEVLYGNEVNPQFGSFDNKSGIFDDAITNPTIWGIYTQFDLNKLQGSNELYYIGFNSPFSVFNDVMGEETRHAIGLRRFGKIGRKASYNSEIIYQFGELGDSDISAINFEADWKQVINRKKWTPIIGLKLDWSTGDRELADGKLQTFNPMFVNPAIYSLAGVNTPANLTSIHPSLTFVPAKGLSIYLEYALFYRTSKIDGLYAPPRFQSRASEGISNRHIGDTVGLITTYNLNRNISFTLISSYFIAGGFIKESGESESIFYIAPTADFKF